MVRSSLTFEPIEFQITPEAGAVSFGGEKEGGDSLITAIMSPTANDFNMIIESMSPKNQKKFLSTFLNGLSKSRFSYNLPVINAQGDIMVPPTLPAIRNHGSLQLSELKAIFGKWLSQTHDRPFAFVEVRTRAHIFDGEFEGMAGKDWIDRAMRVYPRAFDRSRSSDPVPTHFNHWKPIFGEPEKYISRMVTELLGDWELNFRPQTTYGDFEKMMSWFRNALSHPEDGKYNAFGHQWVVLPKRDPTRLNTKTLKQLSEIYKVAQALITLRGIKMQSGILTSMYNEVRSDEMLRSHETERSVMRLKNNLFPSNTGAPAYNIEQRSGTSYNPTRRLVQQAIVSRYASNDWSGLADASSYVLIPSNSSLITENLTGRFDVSAFEAKRALERIQSIKFDGDEEDVQGLRKTSLAPFWNWEHAPFISATKRDFIKRVTRNFIQQLASLPQQSNTEEAVLEEFARWSAIADIDTDIENYMKPKRSIQTDAKSVYLGEFMGNQGRKKIDVNSLDFGIEYTTRFPIRAASSFSEEETKMGRLAFLQIEYDLTPDEKRKVIYDIAKRLAKKLNGRDIEPTRLDSAGHGHKIAITYEIPHPTGGSWRIEWDGIGRDYDLNGNVLTGSERGGVVEIVTPKMNPTQDEIGKLYDVFSDLGVSPSFYAGGGHVNFDLATFDGKPREMARFIALFLQTRDVITTMFQHPGRFTTAEPHSVSQELFEQLLNFDGTEQELKQLLYNNRFFNTRIGRKTKYVQLELSSYFQDVIPEEYITKDFDIKNDYWRKQFRVDPKIRKGEFRLFGAPRNLYEASLQVKLVRALINRAMNFASSSKAKLAKIDVEHLVNHSLQSFGRFDETMKLLELDAEEYEGYFAEGLQNMQHYVDAAFYEPFEKKMANFPQSTNWKPAVAARSAAEAISSKDREWKNGRPEAGAVALRERRKTATRQAGRERRERRIDTDLPLPQSWREFDSGTVAQIKRLRWDKLVKYPEIAIDFIYEKHVKGEDYESAQKRVLDLREKLQSERGHEGESLGLKLDEILVDMVVNPKESPEIERQMFYVLGISRGRIAASAAAHIFEKAKPEDAYRFIDLIAQMPFEYVLDLVTSIDLRRSLYAVKGKSYETAWGDLLQKTISLARTKTRRAQLLWELNLLFREHDVSLGDRERTLILGLNTLAKREGTVNPPNRFGEEEEDMSSLIRRRCTILLI